MLDDYFAALALENHDKILARSHTALLKYHMAVLMGGFFIVIIIWRNIMTLTIKNIPATLHEEAADLCEDILKTLQFRQLEQDYPGCTVPYISGMVLI